MEKIPFNVLQAGRLLLTKYEQQPRLHTIGWLSDGSFWGCLTGEPVGAYPLSGSVDLAGWTSLSTLVVGPRASDFGLTPTRQAFGIGSTECGKGALETAARTQQ